MHLFTQSTADAYAISFHNGKLQAAAPAAQLGFWPPPTSERPWTAKEVLTCLTAWDDIDNNKRAHTMDLYEELQQLLQRFHREQISYAWASRHEVTTDFGPVQVCSPAGLIHLKSLRRSGQDEDDIQRLKEIHNES